MAAGLGKGWDSWRVRAEGFRRREANYGFFLESHSNCFVLHEHAPTNGDGEDGQKLLDVQRHMQHIMKTFLHFVTRMLLPSWDARVTKVLPHKKQVLLSGQGNFP